MNNSINLQILTQTSFDSGSLKGLGAVVHRFDQPGEHRITVFQAEKAIQTFALKVMDIPGKRTTGPQVASGPTPLSPPASSAVHVDLGRTLGSPGSSAPQSAEDTVVAAQGYALFHAPQAAAGFAVQIHASVTTNQPPVFDSRQLHSADIFSVTLFRPGRYSLGSTGTAAKGEIRVSYPVTSDTPYRPPDPVEVQVSQQGFLPSSIQLKPGQGLIFHIGNVTARILIDLVDPDDGPSGAGPAPGGARKPLYRWEKPEPPESKPKSK